MTSGLADVIGTVDSLVDSFGGLPSILLLASTILSTKFAPQLAAGIDLGISKVTTFVSKLSDTGSISGGLVTWVT
jgi:hypothetical protein